MKETREREITSIHEAGHVFVSEFLGYPIRKAYIFPNSDESGKYHFCINSIFKLLFFEEDRAKIIIAGPASQTMFFPGSFVSKYDFRELAGLGLKSEALNQCTAKVQELLKTHADTIRMLAESIDKKGILFQDDISRVIRKH